MLKKLILLTITAIFLTACGASAPAETAASSVSGSPSLCSDEAHETLPSDTTDDDAKEPAESAPETPEYFLFETFTNTVTNDDGLTLLYEQQSIPTFTSPDPQRSAWVTDLLSGIGRDYAVNSSNLYDYAAESIELYGTEYFYSYSNYQQLGVARHDPTVVSLICVSSLYSGGSHPNSVQTAYNLDIENQRLLRLEDVITESGAAELGNMVRSAVQEQFPPIDGVNGLFDDYESIIATSMAYGNMTPYWYLNDEGLVLFYNQYELAPYAAGIICLELPYEDLEGILLEEYFPAEADGVPGDLVLRGDWEGYRRIPITIEAEGETLLIGVEGRVHQVRLSEVLWLDQTPIAQDVLFSAMTLGQNDVLQITGGYTDDARSFAIEFINGQGEHKIYYLQMDGFSEEP